MLAQMCVSVYMVCTLKYICMHRCKCESRKKCLRWCVWKALYKLKQRYCSVMGLKWSRKHKIYWAFNETHSTLLNYAHSFTSVCSICFIPHICCTRSPFFTHWFTFFNVFFFLFSFVLWCCNCFFKPVHFRPTLQLDIWTQLAEQNCAQSGKIRGSCCFVIYLP